MATLKIAVTGPEGSGKTVLSMALSKYFDCPMIKDYSDYYVAKYGEIVHSGLAEIAIGKKLLEKEALTKQPALLISDNDLITLKVWSQYRFNSYENDLKALVDSQYFDMYILTKPDGLPTEPFLMEDPALSNYFFNAYLKELDDNNLPYHIAEGDFYQRQKGCVKVINSLQRRLVS